MDTLNNLSNNLLESSLSKFEKPKEYRNNEEMILAALEPYKTMGCQGRLVWNFVQSYNEQTGKTIQQDTVYATLGRLVKKGLISREKIGKSYFYKLVSSETQQS